MSQEVDLFEILVLSFCLSVFGNGLTKAGILLSLFGSPEFTIANQGSSLIRGEIHTLLIEGTSPGKSQLLKAAEIIAPQSAHVYESSSSEFMYQVTRNGKEFNFQVYFIFWANNGSYKTVFF